MCYQKQICTHTPKSTSILCTDRSRFQKKKEATYFDLFLTLADSSVLCSLSVVVVVAVNISHFLSSSRESNGEC